jgi:hypothetical protein
MKRRKHMRRIVYATFVLLLGAGLVGRAYSAAPQKKFKETEEVKTDKIAKGEQKTGFQKFNLFTDMGSRDNHYIPSGWMGDYGDLKYVANWTDNPHSGKTCVKIVYNANMAQGAGWAGMYWQHPANNWGEKKGGYNLTGATKLTFWARGEHGGEKIAEFKMGGITGEFPDTDSASIGPVELTTKWQKYTIDLKEKDLSNIIGGFCWSASRDDNPDGFILYLDDIAYE